MATRRAHFLLTAVLTTTVLGTLAPSAAAAPPEFERWLRTTRALAQDAPHARLRRHLRKVDRDYDAAMRVWWQDAGRWRIAPVGHLQVHRVQLDGDPELEVVLHVAHHAPDIPGDAGSHGTVRGEAHWFAAFDEQEGRLIPAGAVRRRIHHCQRQSGRHGALLIPRRGRAELRIQRLHRCDEVTTHWTWDRLGLTIRDGRLRVRTRSPAAGVDTRSQPRVAVSR